MLKHFNKVYGNPPVQIGNPLRCVSNEMFFYQYLPIKMLGHYNMSNVPPQLWCYAQLIRRVIADFKEKYGIDSFHHHYMYITAKRLYVTEGSNMNRPGWHSDGFGTPDINYIWCDSVPTEYIETHLTDVSEDCDESLKQFEQVAETHRALGGVKTVEPNVLYRLDESVIHATGVHKGTPIIRTFIKISFSKEKYNLNGNSHNYLIDYLWDMKDRDVNRNHPAK